MTNRTMYLAVEVVVEMYYCSFFLFLNKRSKETVKDRR